MPTTIDSAGITFNDATSFTSAVLAANSVGATQITNGSVTAAKLGTNEQKQIAKAWVNFNGTTSPGTIRSSYNVSSVTKNATGDYTVNFATAMADANYSVCFGNIGVNLTNTTYNTVIAGSVAGGANLKTVNQIRISTGATNAAAMTDLLEISVQVFGN
jgi:hypothetical protein